MPTNSYVVESNNGEPLAAAASYNTDEEDGATSSHDGVANLSDVKVTINVMGMGGGMTATSAEHSVVVIKDETTTSHTTQEIENTSDDSRL